METIEKELFLFLPLTRPLLCYGVTVLVFTTHEEIPRLHTFYY